MSQLALNGFTDITRARWLVSETTGSSLRVKDLSRFTSTHIHLRRAARTETVQSDLGT